MKTIKQIKKEFEKNRIDSEKRKEKYDLQKAQETRENLIRKCLANQNVPYKYESFGTIYFKYLLNKYPELFKELDIIFHPTIKGKHWWNEDIYQYYEIKLKEIK